MVVLRRMNIGTGQPGFESRFCHLLTMEELLCLDFPIWKMRIIVLLTSQGSCED